MILTKTMIQKEIKAKNIKITPFSPRNIGPASYDLTLGNEFRFFKKTDNVQKIDESADYKKITTKVKADKGIIIRPGEFVLGITKEKISLPQDIAGWLQGRSRFARLGLTIHITASFLHPGIANRQVLEIFNAGPDPLLLKPNTKICQIVFERCEGKAKYANKFKNQVL